MNKLVKPGISGAELACPNAGELQDQAFKILQGLELFGTLIKAEQDRLAAAAADYQREAFLENIEYLASTLADQTSQVLDKLPPAVPLVTTPDEVPPTDAAPSIYETRGLLKT